MRALAKALIVTALVGWVDVSSAGVGLCDGMVLSIGSGIARRAQSASPHVNRAAKRKYANTTSRIVVRMATRPLGISSVLLDSDQQLRHVEDAIRAIDQWDWTHPNANVRSWSRGLPLSPGIKVPVLVDDKITVSPRLDLKPVSLHAHETPNPQEAHHALFDVMVRVVIVFTTAVTSASAILYYWLGIYVHRELLPHMLKDSMKIMALSRTRAVIVLSLIVVAICWVARTNQKKMKPIAAIEESDVVSARVGNQQNDPQDRQG